MADQIETQLEEIVAGLCRAAGVRPCDPDELQVAMLAEAVKAAGPNEPKLSVLVEAANVAFRSEGIERRDRRRLVVEAAGRASLILGTPDGPRATEWLPTAIVLLGHLPGQETRIERARLLVERRGLVDRVRDRSADLTGLAGWILAGRGVASKLKLAAAPVLVGERSERVLKEMHRVTRVARRALVRGTLVWATVPYRDRQESKSRPCVVIADGPTKGTTVVCPVVTQGRVLSAGSVSLDWDGAGLSRPSRILPAPHLVETRTISVVVGHLADADLDCLMGRLGTSYRVFGMQDGTAASA
ncbi:MAG: type II toxin-antitoxin system PemK/MazF family toxin [Acidimicrobiales bacterium]